MSNINNKVNTYLYAAQILAGQARDSSNAGERRASIVGSSLSLMQAWQSWLDELSSYLKISTIEIEDESSEKALALPDCQLLFALKRESGSWYQQLSALVSNPLYFYEREFSQSQTDNSVSKAGTINIINVTTVDDEGQFDTLMSVVSDMKAYIQHTREQQTEW